MWDGPICSNVYLLRVAVAYIRKGAFHSKWKFSKAFAPTEIVRQHWIYKETIVICFFVTLLSRREFLHKLPRLDLKFNVLNSSDRYWKLFLHIRLRAVQQNKLFIVQ